MKFEIGQKVRESHETASAIVIGVTHLQNKNFYAVKAIDGLRFFLAEHHLVAA